VLVLSTQRIAAVMLKEVIVMRTRAFSGVGALNFECFKWLLKLSPMSYRL
jgi:hypothetical protein